MFRFFFAVFIIAFTACFAFANFPRPWHEIIDTPEFLNASPDQQRQIRRQWEVDYRNAEEQKKTSDDKAVKMVMVDLWDKHPELHTDTNEYLAFMARRDEYLRQGKPMAEALKLAAADTFPPKNVFPKTDTQEISGQNTKQKQEDTDQILPNKFLDVLYIVLMIGLASLIYLSPYLIIRFFTGHPISKKTAIIVCVVTWIVFHFGFSIAGKKNAVAVVVPFAIAGYLILTRKPREIDKIITATPTSTVGQ